MSCARYYLLLSKINQAAADEKAAEVQAYSTKRYQEALIRLRVHAEDCPQCVEGLKSAFPKLKGKEIHVQSFI